MKHVRDVPGPESKNGDVKAPRFSRLFSDDFPALTEYLGVVPPGALEDKTCTLTLFWDSGTWKICFRDRAFRRLAWINLKELSPTFLASVEDYLTSDNLTFYDDKRRGR